MRTEPTHPTRGRRTGAVWAAVLAVGAASCSSETRLPLHPVRGTVTVRGAPAVNAVVVLRPVKVGLLRDLIPHGVVEPDGTFRIGTYADGDGAPEGEYTVTIAWPETRTDPKTRDEVSADRLEGRYADPMKSRLTVTVRNGENRLEPFRLD